MEKMHTIYSEKRPSGISLIDNLAWGTNFCQFYETEKSLFEIIVPYFKRAVADKYRTGRYPSVKKELNDLIRYRCKRGKRGH